MTAPSPSGSADCSEPHGRLSPGELSAASFAVPLVAAAASPEPPVRRRAPVLRRVLRRIGWTVVVTGVLAGGCLAAGFVAFVNRLELNETRPSRHADGVVALTGGADRISDAVALLADREADRLLISGVNPTTSRTEIARLAPEARDLLDCCIELGYTAANTAGNATETSQWVRHHNIRSLIVVTSYYHMPRALAEIGHAVPDVELVAFPVVSEPARQEGWRAEAQRFKLMLSEYLKYLRALARIRLD